MRPYILLSNDDGYQAAGLQYLMQVLSPVADLLVLAPDGPRSGYACAITTQVPFTLRHVASRPGTEVYCCSGSPVDCVKLAFNTLLPRLRRRPDLVVAGINHGDNSSVNTYYSGTMGVVTEGTFQGVPSIGFSLCDMAADADFSACGPYILRIVRKVLREGLPPFTCLNVNFPRTDGTYACSMDCNPAATDTDAPKAAIAAADPYRGVRLCRMARSNWVDEVAECRRPGSGSPYYWLTGRVNELEPEAEDTDRWALYHGYVAITPQTLDSTAYGLLEAWRADADSLCESTEDPAAGTAE